jgi:probable addiction module antidote protein
MRSKPYRDDLLESLKNPVESAAYLDAALESGDRSVFLLAVKDVTDANGGVREVAATAHLNRETLYRTLSENGNPKLASLDSILHAVGLQLSVEPASGRSGQP